MDNDRPNARGLGETLDGPKYLHMVARIGHSGVHLQRGIPWYCLFHSLDRPNISIAGSGGMTDTVSCEADPGRQPLSLQADGTTESADFAID